MTEESKKKLTKKERDALKDFFQILCDKHEINYRKYLHRFRHDIARQEFTDVNEAENETEKLAQQLKETEEEKKERQRGRRAPEDVMIPVMTPTKEEVEKIKALLKEPQLLYKINKILGKDIVGEDKNRLLLFCLGLSHKTPYKQITVLKGESAIGKNYLADHVIFLYFPARRRGRFTTHALEYSDVNPKEILYLQQLFSSETEGTLRLISTSDRGFILEATIRDEETGRFTTETLRLPPLTLITTTTFLSLDKEFETRIWMLSLDESASQTEKILRYDDETEEEKLKMLKEGFKIDPEKILLRHLVSLLPEVDDIIIPFDLHEYFPTEPLRVRRDYLKFQELVKLIAYLHLYQRPAFEVKGKKIVIAMPQDVYYAKTIGEETIAMTLTGIEERIKDVVEAVKAINEGRQTGATSEGKLLGEVTVNDVKKVTGKGHSTCYEALKKLDEMGCLTKTKRGRENFYLPTDKMSKLSVSVIDSVNYLKLRKTAENRLKQLSQKDFGKYLIEYSIVFNPFTGKEEEMC